MPLTNTIVFFLQLSFVGIRGGEYSGDIALDAIELTEGICEDNALP